MAFYTIFFFYYYNFLSHNYDLVSHNFYVFILNVTYLIIFYFYIIINDLPNHDLFLMWRAMGLYMLCTLHFFQSRVRYPLNPVNLSFLWVWQASAVADRAKCEMMLRLKIITCAVMLLDRGRTVVLSIYWCCINSWKKFIYILHTISQIDSTDSHSET